MQMEVKQKRTDQYAQAIACLPPRLMGTALGLPDAARIQAEELRLRAGQVMRWSAAGQEHDVGGAPVTAEELQDTLARAARWSVHSYGACLRQGYLPLAGGHRLGVCGTAAICDGQVSGIREPSSICLRIAHDHPGAASRLLSSIFDGAQVQGTLILSPPGRGKTTLLRDLIRSLSEAGIRVGVADERGELAALRGGRPQFTLGPCCDVLDGCPKAEAALQLVRTMSPRAVALDEVTDPADLDAVRDAANCGVAVLATIHAADRQELTRKPFYQALCASGAFTRLITIEWADGKRTYRVDRMEDGSIC